MRHWNPLRMFAALLVGGLAPQHHAQRARELPPEPVDREPREPRARKVRTPKAWNPRLPRAVSRRAVRRGFSVEILGRLAGTNWRISTRMLERLWRTS